MLLTQDPHKRVTRTPRGSDNRVGVLGRDMGVIRLERKIGAMLETSH